MYAKEGLHAVDVQGAPSVSSTQSHSSADTHRQTTPADPSRSASRHPRSIQSRVDTLALNADWAPPQTEAGSLADWLRPEPDLSTEEAAAVWRLLRSLPTEGDGPVALSVDGRLRLGPLTGHHQPATARYIGAASREAHRRARMAALELALVELTEEIATVHASLQALSTQRHALRQATEALPSTTALRRALQRRGELQSSFTVYEAGHARAEHAAREAERAAIQARARVDALARASSLPADPSGRAQTHAALLGLRDRVAELPRINGALKAQAETVHHLAERSKALSTQQDRKREEARQEADRLAQEQRQLQAALEAQGADLRALQSRLATARAAAAAAATALRQRHRDAEAARADAAEAKAQQRAAAAQQPEVEAARAEAEAALSPLFGPAFAPILELPAGADRAALHAEVARAVFSDPRQQTVTTQLENAVEAFQKVSPFPSRLTEEEGLKLLRIEVDAGSAPSATFLPGLRRQIDEEGALLQERERQVFEDQLLGSLANKLSDHLQAARSFARTASAELSDRRLSSGMSFSLAWEARPDLSPSATRLLDLCSRDLIHRSEAELRAGREALREALDEQRRRSPDEAQLTLLERALDYRAWHRFALTLRRPGTERQPLTARRHAQLSGGEKAAALYAPLFAAAQAAFRGGRPDAPQLIAMDEAFEGIDAHGKPELLAITVAFGLDLLLTGHDLWLSDLAIPAAMHVHLIRDPVQRLVLPQYVAWQSGKQTPQPGPLSLEGDDD